MNTWLGASFLLIAAVVLYRLIFGSSKNGVRPDPSELSGEHEALYGSVQLEVETQVSMLRVLLNDAIGYRISGQLEMAWSLVNLANSQWEHVTETVDSLLCILRNSVSYSRVPVDYRVPPAYRFKSRPVAENLRLYEFLIELVFRSKLRFNLQVDALRRIAATLESEFRRISAYGERTGDPSDEIWQELDSCLQDLELLARETMLELCACLAQLPETSLESLRQYVEPILLRGVRKASILAAKESNSQA